MCPGCKTTHVVTTSPYPNGWTFNGDYAKPTLTPSVLVYSHASLDKEGRPFYTPRCHSFVRDGKIEFLNDCDHALAGKTVDLPEIECEDA